MNNKNIEEQIENILWNKLSFLIKKYDYDELKKELTNLLTQQREEAVRGFVMEIMKKYVLNISLNDLEDETIKYLSQQREKGE